jgi:hypothetical protein
MRATDRWGVIAQDGEGTFTSIHMLNKDILVRNDASQLKIAIGQVASRVVCGDQTALN